AAEQVLESEGAEVAHEDLERVREIEPAEAARTRIRAGALDPGVAIAVVRRAPLRVAQDLVRLRRFLEALLGLLRPVVPVRVILQRKLPVGLLDRLAVRVACHAQD